MSLNLQNPISAFLLLDKDKVIDCDSATLAMFQCQKEEIISCNLFQKFSAPLRHNGRKVKKMIEHNIAMAYKNEYHCFPWRFYKKDQSPFDAELSLRKKFFQGQEYLLLVIIDISEKTRINEAILVQESYFQQLFENAPEAIAIVHDDTRILNVNHGFERLFKYSHQEAVGRKISDLLVPDELKDEYWQIGSLVRQGDKPRGETIRKRKDGSLVHVSFVAFPIIYNNKYVGYYAIYLDITDRKKAEERLKYITFHDPLTGSYNRSYFEQKLQELQHSFPQQLGLIVCDIDGLKIINDTLSHNAGDEILINTARLISQYLDETAVFARIGGDEFAILLPDYDEAAVSSLVDKIREAINNYNADQRNIPLNISLGFSIMKDPSRQDIRQLYIEADNNMYRNKLHRGKSMRSTIVQTLMAALEARDIITEDHAERLQLLVTRMAEALGLSENNIQELRLLCKFHDIGKVGIPDKVLFKPGPLTAEERRIMQHHSEIGSRIAQSAPDLAPISDWILKHHEWWNGQGYPLGIKGEDIPLECRILAIADAFDAMTNDRPYRKALPPEKAIAEIKSCSGTQFDPAIVEKCLPVLEKLSSLDSDR